MKTGWRADDRLLYLAHHQHPCSALSKTRAERHPENCPRRDETSYCEEGA